MNEQLFQFIWNKQYFNNTNLYLFSGESISIVDPGIFNSNQGPDFLNALIRIDSLLLAGNIELHLKTSDWLAHQHSNDPMYNNIILHVVLENDLATSPNNLPLLELKPLINKSLLDLYLAWNRSEHFIPCGEGIRKISDEIKSNLAHKLIEERLIQKSNELITQLELLNFHWDELTWQTLSRSFGAKLNSDAFQRIAENLPLALLNRHRTNLIQLESLVLGRAGLLTIVSTDPYIVLLQQEYKFLKKKYQWKDAFIPIVRLRMRPENFPEIRLAQLAKFLHEHELGLHQLISDSSLGQIQEMLKVTANDFWHYHYTLLESSKYSPKQTGATFINTIVLNAIIPLMYAYGVVMKNEKYLQKALKWLAEFPPESNRIITEFSTLDWLPENALDSQALLHLKKSYCDRRRCLDCQIGQFLLKESITEYSAPNFQ